ncbi:MAG: FG-GAP repeat protein [Planctomycetes bacterium]|nr:FG-GAP repeat protein [Planctomycetota bacterium]
MVSTSGQRVSYAWDELLTEWYINEQRGLEHGFTVHARPESASEQLTLELAIRGDLRAVVSENGRDVGFVDALGSAVLTYSGLTVFDAERQPLAAGWEFAGERLQLRIEDQDARYPLTIDPIAQQAYLKAANGGAGDQFGCSVAISGDTVVVGAFNEDSAATGVNGDPNSNAANNSGAAYVFVRSGPTWTQQAYLKASNSQGFDEFGWSVAISGDTLVVGAAGEDSAATGVGGNSSSNAASSSGAAYVFVRSGTTWTQQAYLKASNTQAFDNFGIAVAISGDSLVVGAHQEDSDATGVNGDSSSNAASSSGAAYVFVRSGSTWTQQAYLKASNTDAFDQFGISVASSGDTVLVGAWLEGSAATGVNGDQSSDVAFSAGAAYVFVRSGTNWIQQAYLKASNTDVADFFGRSVAAWGDTVVVCARGEGSAATGVDGDQSSNAASGSGAAYVFVRSGSTWNQQAYLKASNTEMDDTFGVSVAVWGNTLVIGAVNEDSVATGVDGDAGNNSAANSGAAYVFARSGATWTQQAYLKASNTELSEEFGCSVATFGDTVIAGARFEDSAATGVNGDQSSNAATDSGAVYVFALTNSVSYCTAGTSTHGCLPSISATGAPSLAATSGFSIDVVNVEGDKQGLLFYGLSGRAASAWGAGGASLQCVKAPTQRMPAQNSGGTNGLCDGALSADWLAYIAAEPSALGQPFSAGTTVNAQAWYRDPPAVKATNLSNALEFVVAP